MGMNPHQVTRDFERALCEYTGARFAVAVNSCTAALLLAVKWHFRDDRQTEQGLMDSWGRSVEIPSRTYVSVPMSIIHAGGRPVFRDEPWEGAYQLKPLPVWDSARYFTSNLWNIYKGFVCVSFHASKTLGDTQGGAILHDNPEADKWLRKARFDGRTEGVAPKDDAFDMVGWHAYLSPDVAARLLMKMHSLPQHSAPLSNDNYPELDKMEIFQ